MKKRRKRYFPLLVVVLMGGYLLSSCRLAGASEREFPVLAQIRAQERADAGSIELEIQKKEQQEKEEQKEQEQKIPEEKREQMTPRERFGTAVIVGDSIAEGYLDYQILNPESIVAKKGIRTDTAMPEIEKALALNPSCLFLSIGMNDLEYCWGESARFAGNYRELLKGIRELNQEIPIYVNGILPILPAAVEKKPVMGNVDAFNEALQEVCAELEVVYVDSSDLLEGKEEWYQKDAIHLKSPFYPLWLERMEETAGL